MTHPIDAIIAGQQRMPAMARVLTPPNLERFCDVQLINGTVRAKIADLPRALEVGDTVCVLPIGDTYLIIATVNASTESGGVQLAANLLPNPGFTGDASGWGYVSSGSSPLKIYWDRTSGHDSPGSVRWDAPAGKGAYIDLFNAEAIRVDPGAVYRVAGWSAATKLNGTAFSVLELYTAETADKADRASGTKQRAATCSSRDGNWGHGFADLTIPDGHTFARVFMTTWRLDTDALWQVWWDDVALQRKMN